MSLDPRIVLLLAKAGLEIGKESLKNVKEILRLVDENLEQKYRFFKPRKFPRLGYSLFRVSATRTISGRQFVLEEGLFRGKWWRIREKAHPFATYYFVWDTYESPSQAKEQWESFCALVEARERLTAAGGIRST